jgi:hypothetical protein
MPSIFVAGALSLKLLPHFLAMRGVIAVPGDHQRFYGEGRLRDDARLIWEALEKHGLLATLELRHACKMDTKAGNIRFKRAILDLQRLLVVTHFGAEQETDAWASGCYELTCRAFPKETKAARGIPAEEARRQLVAKFIEWHPSATPAQMARLFGWSKAEAVAAQLAANANG